MHTVSKRRDSSLALLARAYGRLRALSPSLDVWTVALVAIGIAAAVAESLGIALVVLLLHVLAGETAPVAVAGPVGDLFRAFEDAGTTTAAAVAVALILLQIGARAAYQLASEFIGLRLSERVRNAIHDGVLAMPYDDLLGLERAVLLDAFAQHSFRVVDAYNTIVRLAVASCALAVFGALLLATSATVALLAALGSALVAIGMRSLRGLARDVGRRLTDTSRDMTTAMLRTVQGMRTIRSFALEQRSRERMASLVAAQTAAARRQATIGGVLSPATEGATVLVLVLVFLAASAMGVGFAATLTCVAIIYRAQPRLREVDWALLRVQELASPLEIALGLADKPALRAEANEVRTATRSGDIAFSGVSLEMTRPRSDASRVPIKVLDGVTFTIPERRRTALVGPSGSGKTTITSLLARLREPTSGVITVGGVPLREIGREAWLRSLALCGQDMDLLDETLRENLLFVRPSATDADVHAVLKVCELTSLVESLPDGLETWIGEYGHQVSGGQRQRIGLARALLARPKLLVLDEALNALDEPLEARLRRRLFSMQATTILYVTHRLDHLADCDHLIVLDGAGRVAYEGDPADWAGFNAVL